MKISSRLTVAVFISLLGCTEPVDREKIIVDIPALLNRNPAEVEALLGKPDSVYTEHIVSRVVPVYRYLEKDIAVDVQFWDGKATDIVVPNAASLPFAPGTLEVFGIVPREPTSQSENVYLKWEKLNGMKNVNFYVTGYAADNRISQYRIFFKADKP